MKNIQGLYTALVTPFTETGVDYESLSGLVERQVEAGVDGIVVLGSTGEPATISSDERHKIIQSVVNQVGQRIDVVVGVGESSTAETVGRSLVARDLGASGLLVVSPYGNKPPQTGLIAHFTKVADSVDIPVILYNIPCRTGTYIKPRTIMTLSEHSNIIGVKDASSNFADMAEIVEKSHSGFAVISGNDSETFDIMKRGGQGVIAVSSNLIPEQMKSFIDHCSRQNWRDAEELHDVYTPLFEMLFYDTNPIPVKTILAEERLCNEEFRLPLLPMRGLDRDVLIDDWDRFKQSLG